MLVAFLFLLSSLPHLAIRMASKFFAITIYSLLVIQYLYQQPEVIKTKYKNRSAMQDFFTKHCIGLKDEPYLLDDYWSGFNINILFQRKPMLSIDNVLPLNPSFIIDALKTPSIITVFTLFIAYTNAAHQLILLMPVI
ncbi:uncharacterized protein LOC106871493 [Octopus bimaculoides]|uniref:Uncharacterized protein n=1 Tax=Octopus bimaculoides TaxID=37653 RepID=A0A0L8HE81_OCTBM|nr:uncharacterized protein LOC106871493 [Octopus bimaculoides]|eukprot:XP_014773462.1 PREDICTED: uncharacterized protein LOC106871493 [Octopus bimaculoides]